ncbi:blue-sensitive opsin-like [Paramacrobiotus metropolitanus]|uniref:blue-sensitive opsin-like n=1 Tax=Paramacrobiotus metropolitanus TaxID=2943436 RepID=UPI002445FE01|nr:blue-sensitive opsin-like [Paramacrobiotus metropolitanus]
MSYDYNISREEREFFLSSMKNASVNQTLNALHICAPLTPEVIFLLTCGILMVVLNSLLVVIFIFHRELRSPFSVYLIALSIANVLCSGRSFCNAIQEVCPHFLYHPVLCDLRLYVGWCLSGLPENVHLLIAVNRIWAVALPISYRNHHSIKLAIVLSAAAFVYVQVLTIPSVAINAWYYRPPLDKYGCFVNTFRMPVWYEISIILIFEFPVVFVLFTWIYLMVRLHRSAKRAAMRKGLSQMSEQMGAIRQNKFNGSFAVFSFLTIGAVVCWLPYETMYVVWGFRNRTESERKLPLNLLAVYTLQQVLDPVLIVLTSKPLRLCVRRIVGCRT